MLGHQPIAHKHISRQPGQAIGYPEETHAALIYAGLRKQTAEAIKQRRKREKEAERNKAFGVEKFTIEVAGGVKA